MIIVPLKEGENMQAIDVSGDGLPVESLELHHKG